MLHDQVLIRSLVGFVPMLVIGIAAPCWAQSAVVPTSPDDPASKSLGWIEAAPAPPTDRGPRTEPAGSVAVMRPVPHHTRPLRRARRDVQHSRTKGVGENDLANYLNRQELARLQAGSAPLQQKAQSYRR
jgi:hypothetical protein